eukprot:TRINITY_DN37696_c2_g1_i1.p2 TRINITY_DN37696_c2_g1~~TRINITY_DN37696_c2_g1_i1.p2  ORF type:complete len:123 (+),score=8.90 TRINITY_DN37696_c2_g1_i1:156-524(+)
MSTTDQDPMYGMSQNVNIPATSKSMGFGRTEDVPTSQVFQTLKTCKQIYSDVNKFTNLPLEQKFRERLHYLREITGQKQNWWLENVAACGAPDDICLDTRKEVHFVLMSKKEIQGWLLTGRY